MKAAIISIGTELTDGQILNSNATWISKELKKRGVSVVSHHTVPDDFSLMMQSLRYADIDANLIFVTGGLGPTSDDFTRDVISKWANKELFFDEISWRKLEAFFAILNRVPHEIQKQQCYFPKGAVILENSKGTANAFCLQVNQNTVYVLPGPPLEIQAVWQDHIAAQLDAMTAHLDPVVTQSWDLLEISEPDAALTTEKVVKSPLITKGYRVHIPYVEVKITYLKSHESVLQPEIEALNSALKDFTVVRNGGDVLKTLLAKISTQSEVTIVDTLTKGKLAQRLGSGFFASSQKRTFCNDHLAKTEGLLLEVHADKENHYKFIATSSQKSDELIINLTHIRKERQIIVALERALIFWSKNL